MHLVYRCSLPSLKKKFLEEGDPCDLFLPRPGSAPGRIWPKNNNTCKGPTKIHQNPSSGSGEEVKNVKSFRTTTEGRTTDGAL